MNMNVSVEDYKNKLLGNKDAEHGETQRERIPSQSLLKACVTVFDLECVSSGVLHQLLKRASYSLALNMFNIFQLSLFHTICL